MKWIVQKRVRGRGKQMDRDQSPFQNRHERQQNIFKHREKRALENRPSFLRQGMALVRQVTIGPMLVGRKPEKIGWESVPMPPASPLIPTGWRTCRSGPTRRPELFLFRLHLNVVMLPLLEMVSFGLHQEKRMGLSYMPTLYSTKTGQSSHGNRKI